MCNNYKISHLVCLSCDIIELWSTIFFSGFVRTVSVCSMKETELKFSGISIHSVPKMHKIHTYKVRLNWKMLNTGTLKQRVKKRIPELWTLSSCCLCGLFFDLEDRGSTVLWEVELLSDCKVSHPRRWYSFCLSCT